jgi:hypothetical protein
MKALRFVLGACVVLALAGVSVAGDKPNPPTKDEKKDDKKDKNDFKEKIIGTFEVVEDPGYEKGTLITFSKDGKCLFKKKGERKAGEMTYKIDGDKLTISYGKITTPPLKIEKITDEEMILDFGGAKLEGGQAKWKRK